MTKRTLTPDIVQTIIEQGDWLDKGNNHGWISHHFPERTDNLLCVAAIIEQAVIIKTVMTGWQPEETPS